MTYQLLVGTPTILSAVMLFGKCFTLIGFDLYLKDYADQI